MYADKSGLAQERLDVETVLRCNGAGLTLEPLAEIGIVGDMRGEHIDGDGAVQAGVGGFVDLAHASRAEGGLDLVGAERGAGLQRHKLLVGGIAFPYALAAAPRTCSSPITTPPAAPSAMCHTPSSNPDAKVVS